MPIDKLQLEECKIFFVLSLPSQNKQLKYFLKEKLEKKLKDIIQNNWLAIFKNIMFNQV